MIGALMGDAFQRGSWSSAREFWNDPERTQSGEREMSYPGAEVGAERVPGRGERVGRGRDTGAKRPSFQKQLSGRALGLGCSQRISGDIERA